MAPFCINCVQGYRLPGTPTGGLVRISPSVVEAYLASRHSTISDETARGKKAVVYLTDIFGLPLGNPQIVADMINERMGIDVYVPDMFDGRPPLTDAQLGPYLRDSPSSPRASWGQKLGLVWTALKALPAFIPSRPSVVNKRTENFLKVLKEKGYDSVGVVGYCYGGGVAVHVAVIGPEIAKSVVIAHPSIVSIEQVNSFKVPTAWVIAEDDDQVPPELQKRIQDALAGKDTQFEWKVYPGTTHGFAARPNLAIPEVKEAFEAALDQTIAWFEKTL